MFIERPPLWFRWLFPGVLFRVKPSGKKPGTVYLTFDDGPIPEVTPWVLDILDKFKIKATFFMVGQNVEKYPEIYREVVKRGHVTGNHTHHHLRGFFIKSDEYLKDVEQCNALIKSDLFRPPHGWLSLSQLKAVRRKFRPVMYDLVTRDYSRRINAEEVFNNIRKYTRDGSVIVFHDSLKSFPKIKTALPQSLEWLKNKGYEFEVLSRLVSV